jgi:hypothetical protein
MSESWNTSAEHERIKNRAKRLKEQRESRANQNPEAFGWTVTDDGTYKCDGGPCDCGKEYRKLPNCIRHVKRAKGTDKDQTGLEEWA